MLSAESQQQCFADDQLGDYERRDRGSREPRAGRGAEATPSGNWDRERENENYVCDITMMRIEDGEDDGDDVGFHSHTNNVESSNNSDDPTNNNHAPDFDQVSLSSSDSGRSPSSDFSSDADSDGGGPEHRFLDELAVDRREEEATITELVRASGDGQLMDSSQSNRMRVAFGILLRLMLPLANGVARSLQGIRDVRFLRALKNLATSRQALTNVIAFAANTISMGLSSVQVTHRIEPLLKLMKIGRPRDGLESLPDIPSPAQGGPPGPASAPSTPTTPPSYSPFVRAPRGSLPRYSPGKRRAHEPPAPKCCTLDVLAEPPPGTPVRADVVFIHGLHGSLVNTWKQGLWENERRPVEFERPPRPPVRPPKRPRHSRSSAARPPHHQKRARFARHPAPESDDCFEGPPGEFDDNDFAYICGEPEEVHVCDGLEYSFPTFRLRMNDSSRLLQAELESILNGGRVGDEGGSPGRERERGRGQQKPGPGPEPPRPKPSADDPNYSRCWPGDWLPLDCPGVRVLALNYTTDQYLWRPLWKQKEPRSNLVQRAREMAELLIAQRVGYGHPIVWVGHSKGGLFVKQIIVDAWESGRPAAAPFWRSARGVFFYSVPHRGSHLASIKAPLLSRSVELIDIEKNSKYLVDLHRRFAGLYHLGHLKIEVFSFVETALTLMSVLYLRIVGVDSADPGIGDVCGIHLDHREICKPRSRECILYKELVKMINKVC